MTNDADQNIERAVEKVSDMALPEDFFFGLTVEAEGNRWFIGGTYEAIEGLPRGLQAFSFGGDFANKEDAKRCHEAVYVALLARGGIPDVRITG